MIYIFLIFFNFVLISNASQEILRAYKDQSCAQLLENGLKALKAGREPIIPNPQDCILEAKILRWLWFRNNSGDFQERFDFLKENSGWPDQKKIRIQAELSINAGTPAKEVLTFFEKFPVATSEGAMAYAYASRLKNAPERAALVQKLWQETDFTKSDEKSFYKTYKKILTKEDHAARINRLIYEGNYYGLERIKPLVSTRAREAINFVNNLLKKKRFSKGDLKKLSPYYQNNSAVFVRLIQANIAAKKEQDVLELFRTALDGGLLHEYPVSLRKYRNYCARSLMKKGQNLEAHTLLTTALVEEEKENLIDYVEGEWLAAWLALRKLGHPKEAAKRFSKLYALVKTPISQSKMAYWTGESYETLGNKETAREWFKKGAIFPHTFYGQCCLEKLDKPLDFDFEETAELRPEKESDKELFHVLKILVTYHFDQESEDLFLFLAKTLSAHNTKALIAVADNLGLKHMIVLGTKFAAKNGAILLEAVYPVRPVPSDFPFLTKPLLLSLIRQESGFNEKIVSSAYAKGLMQLVAPTARQLAKRHKIEFKDHYLTTRPDINLTLGSHYLSDLMKKYDGNIPLTLAAYNAGPKPAAEWVKAFGDPRDPNVNLVDWIESISFGETRSYIQRILETIPVYQKRLGEKPQFYS
ncbi:MAG: lytic transglycosylase domain-containing protein [Alphaproteobacteria bacterium]